MKTILKSVTAFLLFFNGAGAIYGGGSLILHPDGSGIQLSLHWLEHTPFSNYLIPGIILLLVNGVFSVMALTALLRKQRNYMWLVMGQGIVLLGWLTAQILLIQTLHFMHIVMIVVGMMLMIFGWLELNVEYTD
jgi:hypothetical protein